MIYTDNVFDHEAQKPIDKHKRGVIQHVDKLSPTKPTWTMVRLAKLTMGAVLLFSGVCCMIAFAFKADETSILTNQLIEHGQWVGRVQSLPRTVIIVSISPLLILAFGSVVVGAWLSVSMTKPILMDMYFEECSLYTAYLAYYQVCFQAIIVIFIVLPLSGVVNIFEFMFASALTSAEFIMFMHSDIINTLALNSWDIVDCCIEKGDTPQETYRVVMGNSSTPWFTFSYEPLITGTVLHFFCWIIIFVHLGYALDSNSYDIDRSFVFIVFFSFICQTIVPLCKIVQLRLTKTPPLFTSYKFVVIVIELVQFANFVVIAIALISN